MGSLVTCVHAKALAAGETGGFVLHTSIAATATRTIVNSAHVEGGNTDSASAEAPTISKGLASTGGVSTTVALFGLAMIGGGLLLVHRQRWFSSR